MNYEDILRTIKPYVLGWIEQTTVQAGAVGSHQLGGPVHTGTLLSSQAPQFALLDGSRPFSGIVMTEGGLVDGVDVGLFKAGYDLHVADSDAHHAGFVGLLDDASTLINPNAQDRIKLAGGTLIDVVGGTGLATIGLEAGSAQYQTLITGANPFAPVWTGLSTLAGAGLGFAAGQFGVGAGTLISVGADVVSLANGSAQYQVPVTGANPFTPAWTGLGTFAGAGLTFSSAFAVGAGALISVAADNVSLANGSAQYQVPVTGANPYTPGYVGLDTFAGDALKFTSGAFHVDPGDGLEINTDKIRLITPGTLSSTSLNNPLLNHTHAVTAVSDGYTDKGQLLKTDGAGNLKLNRADLVDRLRTPLIDSEAAASLTLQPGQNLLLSPGSALVKATTGVQVQSDGYASQTTGWRVSFSGEGDFRYLYADELHAKAFIADLEQALAGMQIITKSVAKLAQEFKAPAEGDSAQLHVEEFAGFTGAVFADSDIVRVRTFTRSAGSLTVADCWGTVVYVGRNASVNPPQQQFTFTRSGAGLGGSIVAETVIDPGTLVLDYGQSAGGFYEVNAIDGADGANSPYSQTAIWGGHPAAGLTVTTRQGNLRGLFGIANEHGLFAGVGVSDASKYLRLSNQAIEAHNLPMNFYDGATQVIKLVPGTSPYLSIGSPAPTGFADNVTGVWAGKDSAAYKMRVGTVAGGLLTKGWAWDGTGLTMVGNLTLGGSGALNYGVSLGAATMVCHWDGPTPYNDDYTGDLNGHMGQVPDISGGLIFRPGKFGKAVQIGETTTNYVNNPTFQNNVTDSWTKQGGGTVSQSATQVHTGTYSLKIVGGLTATAVTSNTVSLSNGGTVTIQAMVFRGSSGSLARLQLRDSTNNATRAQALPTKFGEWELLTASWTNNTGAAVAVAVRLSENATGGAIESYYDSVQMELKAYPTPFAHGSMGFGHSWSGAEHNSSSSRSGSFLAYTLNMPQKFSVGLWVTPTVSPADAETDSFLLSWRYDADSQMSLFYNAATDAVELLWSSSPLYRSTLASTPISRFETKHFVITHDGTTLKLYVNGVLVASGEVSRIVPTPPLLGVGCNAVYVGRDSSGQVSGYYDDLFVTDYTLSSTDVEAIYKSNAPVAYETSTSELFLRDNLSTGYVRGNARGLFGYKDATGGANSGSFALVSTNTTALGAEFGSPTLDAGDFLLGSAGGGRVNLFYDESGGSLTLRSGTTERIRLNADGSGFLASNKVAWDSAGNTTIAGWKIDQYTITAQSGQVGLNSQVTAGTDIRFWAGHATPASAPFRVNETGYMYASNAEIIGTIDANAGFLGSLTVDGTLTIGASGKLVAGTVSNGIVLGYLSDGYYLRGVSGGVTQFDVKGSDGRLYSGAGAVAMDAGGITITSTTSAQDTRAYKFSYGGAVVAGMYHFDSGLDPNRLLLISKQAGAQDGHVALRAEGSTAMLALELADGIMTRGITITKDDVTNAIPLWKQYGELRVMGDSEQMLSINPITGERTQIDFKSAYTSAEQAMLDFNVIPYDSNDLATIRLFRATNTTGTVSFEVYKGNNSSIINHRLAGSNVNSYVCANNGNFGVKTSSPGAALDVYGDIWCSGLISTDRGTNKWELGAWATAADAVSNGYVTVTINGTAYRLMTRA